MSEVFSVLHKKVGRLHKAQGSKLKAQSKIVIPISQSKPAPINLLKEVEPSARETDLDNRLDCSVL